MVPLPEFYDCIHYSNKPDLQEILQKKSSMCKLMNFQLRFLVDESCARL